MMLMDWTDDIWPNDDIPTGNGLRKLDDFGLIGSYLVRMSWKLIKKSRLCSPGPLSITEYFLFLKWWRIRRDICHLVAWFPRFVHGSPKIIQVYIDRLVWSIQTFWAIDDLKRTGGSRDMSIWIFVNHWYFSWSALG